MKIFGHPVHIILIHFPSALFPMDLACSLISFSGGPGSMMHAAYYASVGGVALGFLAMITGAFDLLPLVKNKPAAINKALLHGSLNSVVVIGFAVLTYLSYRQFPEIPPDSVPRLAIKSLLVALLMGGNFLGGSLILKDRVGVE